MGDAKAARFQLCARSLRSCVTAVQICRTGSGPGQEHVHAGMVYMWHAFLALVLGTPATVGRLPCRPPVGALTIPTCTYCDQAKERTVLCCDGRNRRSGGEVIAARVS